MKPGLRFMCLEEFQTPSFVVGACPVRCRTCNSIAGCYPGDIRSTSDFFSSTEEHVNF